MTGVRENPTCEDIEEACSDFDKENRFIEEALGELFTQFHKNTKTSQVLLKVTAVNTFYSTQIPLYDSRIPTIWEVVDQIIGLGIDSSLDQGSHELIFKIAEAKIPNKKIHYNYSFATKYCSWHNPKAYPIFDSRVCAYLWHLRLLGTLSRFKRKDLWIYPRFVEVVDELIDNFDLGLFTYKEIDKFLYREGGKLLATRPKNKNCEAIAAPIEEG
jgi:hypothetical protein